MNEFPASQLREQLSLAKLQKRHAAKVSLRRASLMICCTVGIGWVTNLDFWQIKEQTQIKVSGVELVDKSTIYSSVSFNYPQPVWQIDGAQLAQSIATIPSIAEVKVNRQVIPPQILISLTEKTPVALASVQGKVGFLDAQGTWIAQEFYSNIAHDDILPQLKVINYDLRFSQIWLKLHNLISLYPELKISEVSWNQSNSITIKAETGSFFLGAESSRLEKQFQIMSQLESLPQQIDPREIAYIDLSNPGVNLIQRY